MFFGPATIQPQKYTTFDGESVNIGYVKDLNYNLLNEYSNNRDMQITLLYTKEELTKLGISLSELEQLEAYDIFSIPDNVEDYIVLNENTLENNFIIDYYNYRKDAGSNNITLIEINKHRGQDKYILRYNIYGDDNIYMIADSLPDPAM